MKAVLTNTTKVGIILGILLAYGCTTVIAVFSYGYLFSGVILDIENWSNIFLGAILHFIFLPISLFSYLSLTSIIFIKRKPIEPYGKFVFICCIAILCSYLIHIAVFGFLSTDDRTLQMWRGALPMKFGSFNSEIFWGNYVFGPLFFYSWFLPLWYYKLGDWFWGRGKWAKDECIK